MKQATAAKLAVAAIAGLLPLAAAQAQASASDYAHAPVAPGSWGYVPIAGGTRVSIGIFSYLNTMTFGINADFDAFPDVDVLSGGIRRGIDELIAAARDAAPSPAAT